MSDDGDGNSGCSIQVGFGCLIAVVLSWIVNKSIFWGIIHCFLGWFYVVYWILCRSKLYDWLCSIAV
jgi:hypothetical protein